jgi:hypothetical protein
MERLFRVIGQRLAATSRSGAGVAQQEVDSDV